MKLSLIVILICVVFASCAYRRSAPIQSAAADEILYRGEKIKLSKAYYDFDDYKNDPENIHPSETERVQKLVIEAPIAREFKSLQDVSTAVMEIAFPGYGTGGFRELKQSDGSMLSVCMVEIPRAEKSRYLAFRGANETYRLIDDFVAPDFPSIDEVTVENGMLVYRTSAGQTVLTRPLPAN